MKNLKLIRLLRSFSGIEFQEFGKFVNSPFFNESPKLIALYIALKKFYPAFDDPKLQKEYLFQKLYGNIIYDDKKIRDRLSDLLKLAEDYLSYVGMVSYPPEQKRFTLREYIKRDLDLHFVSKYKEIENYLNNEKIINTEYLEQRYLQIRDKIAFEETRPLLGNRKETYDNVGEEVKCFLQSFSAEMLTYYTVMHNWSVTVKYDFDYTLYDVVMKYVETEDFSKSPFIVAMYLILRIKDTGDENNKFYFELKKLLNDQIDTLDERDKVFISTVLFNESLDRVMKEKFEFTECFDILKTQLELETYPRDGEWISREQYFNYVTIPLELGEIDWAEKFIKILQVS